MYVTEQGRGDIVYSLLEECPNPRYKMISCSTELVNVELANRLGNVSDQPLHTILDDVSDQPIPARFRKLVPQFGKKKAALVALGGLVCA